MSAYTPSEVGRRAQPLVKGVNDNVSNTKEQNKTSNGSIELVQNNPSLQKPPDLKLIRKDFYLHP